MISVCFIKLIKKGCGLCRYVQSLLDAKLLLTSTETLEPSSTISLNLKYTNKRTKFKIAGTVQKETPQVISMVCFLLFYLSLSHKADLILYNFILLLFFSLTFCLLPSKMKNMIEVQVFHPLWFFSLQKIINFPLRIIFSQSSESNQINFALRTNIHFLRNYII